MAIAPTDRRGAARIDKVFRVLVTTEERGDQWFIARNISATGMFVEMPEPLPLRTKVIIRFAFADQANAICAVARVQNHYYLQFSDAQGLRGLTGVGLRFLRFVPEIGICEDREQLH
jgi:hypothetical protein